MTVALWLLAGCLLLMAIGLALMSRGAKTLREDENQSLPDPFVATDAVVVFPSEDARRGARWRGRGRSRCSWA